MTHWARGGEWALAELPRAKWSRPYQGDFVNSLVFENSFYFFSTCGDRKSIKRPFATVPRSVASAFRNEEAVPDLRPPQVEKMKKNGKKEETKTENISI